MIFLRCEEIQYKSSAYTTGNLEEALSWTFSNTSLVFQKIETARSTQQKILTPMQKPHFLEGVIETSFSTSGLSNLLSIFSKAAFSPTWIDSIWNGVAGRKKAAATPIRASSTRANVFILLFLKRFFVMFGKRELVSELKCFPKA